MIKIDFNFDLWKNKIKGSLDLKIKVYYENVFFVILWFVCIELKLQLSEQEN